MLQIALCELAFKRKYKYKMQSARSSEDVIPIATIDPSDDMGLGKIAHSKTFCSCIPQSK